MFKIATLLFLISIYIFHPPADLLAKPKHMFKIASLAPEGSVWVNSFKEFAAEVTEKTNGEVGFRIYPGGIMGDDKAMYRKLRVGQLHGGGFTMTGISEIVDDFRVMAIPFLFQSYEEMDKARKQLQPMFKERFAEKGLHLVAMTEVGFIYTFSNRPRVTIADLQAAKTWAPTDDPLTSAFLNNLKISPIALTIPDVLSSLQTGLIDTAFNSLYGSIILQWYTKAPFVTDAPYGYAYGAFIMNAKAIAKLSDVYLAVIEETADKYFSELIQKTRKSNEESRAVLISQGVKFIPTTPEELATLEQYRDQTIEQVRGKAFSEEIYQTLDQTLTELRSGKDGVN
ncbi:MAG: TRAP transporter substrate-binding protein DctP [Desulfofustis sp.]|nr:TRAP transporter substrate-binding protein DctP [Desulfofustis sp.]